MAPQTERSWKVIAVSLIGLGFIVFLANVMRSMMARVPPSEQAVINYNPHTICPDAFNEDLDFSKKDIRYFDVKLREGCFGGFVHLPSSWHTWEDQPIGDQQGYWIAYWIANEANSRGPFYPNSKSVLNLSVTRLQGHGTVRFYTNVDAPAPTQSLDSPNPLPALSRLSVFHIDSHICEKPPEAYYAITQQKFDASSEYGSASDGHSPEFLFDSNHFDGTITWGNGFKGKIPVCLLVDTKGGVSNINFPQSPGKEIEDHIKSIVAGWHFKGAYVTKWGDPSIPYPVSVQLADMFTFE
jgi:hypothetical protein